MTVSVIGIDLAKNTFSLCFLNSRGKVLSNKKLSRKKLIHFLHNSPKAFIGMEACGGAHYWARMATKAGHSVKMIHPKFVKPFVKTNKNDGVDSQAIAEAAVRESVPSIPIKQTWQQDILVLHRIKERLVKNRIALSNEARGFLLEFGVTIPLGKAAFRSKALGLINSSDSGLSELFILELKELLNEFDDIQNRITQVKNKIFGISKSNDKCKKLEKLPGVGPMISTAIVASAGNGTNFKNGRHFAAWMGLVPKHSGTGGRTRTGGVSKRGDRYLRKLLVQGAQTVINWSSKNDNPQRRWINEKLRSKQRNKVAIAVANKNARILWKLLSSNEEYNCSLAYTA